MVGKENKIHIGIYGRRNVGKSSLINFLTGQQVAIVSEQEGTTTDPVKRSFEIPGLGIVLFIDTAGIDDKGDLGQMRVARTMETIQNVDFALVVVDNKAAKSDFDFERQLFAKFNELGIPYLIVLNKSDLLCESKDNVSGNLGLPYLKVSSVSGMGRDELIEAIKKSLPKTTQPTLFAHLLKKGDIVLLITPIDSGAPQGRLILPQVTAIRDILDNNAIAVVLKENELAHFLQNSGIKPSLAVTDSQLFKLADELIPKEIPLTSFSILMARMKGDFNAYLKGVAAIDKLKDGDRIILLENCSHHASCDDIGRVKIPAWMRQYTGKSLIFEIIEGLDKLTRPVEDYALAVQCGGCMITRKQLINRITPFINAGVPVTNYGMAIAYLQGTFGRATQLFH